MTREWDPRAFREPLAFGISDAALLAFNMRTAVAVTTRASAALTGSPFGLLDVASALRLVTDLVHEDDALCLALTCRAVRDALWERFPPTSFRAWDTSSKVRKTPTWPSSWAKFSLLWPYGLYPN
jgi:hypothetical protein